MYYDLNFCESSWFGLKSIKPIVGGKEVFKKKGFTILKYPSKELFRKAIEKALVDAIWPDRLSGKDKLTHPYTLLNNVNAKLMAKYHVSLLFPFVDILKTSGVERAKVWNRMKYEMKICIKKKVPVIIASMAEKEDELVGLHTLRAFGELLGLPPNEAKKALYYVHEKIIERENGTLP